MSIKSPGRGSRSRGVAATCSAKRMNRTADHNACARQEMCVGCVYDKIHRCKSCGAPLCVVVEWDAKQEGANRGMGGNGACRMMPHLNRVAGPVCMECANLARSDVL